MTTDSIKDELERLRDTCRVKSAGVVPKAQEILRLMEIKCRSGSLGRGELCRTVLAFDLACRALECPISRGTAVKLSSAPEAVYAASIGTAQRLLGLQRRYTPEEVATEIGDASVGTMAAKELRRYQERFLDSYPSRQVVSLDLDGTVYAVAAVYLSAKKLKHSIDKQRLLEFALVGEEEFSNVCSSMLDLCYSTLGVAPRDKSREDLLRVHHLTSSDRRASSSVSNRTRQSDGSNGSANGKASSGTPRQVNADRRPIPLTRDLSGRDPKGHVASLSRSIQRTANRKRHGGATVIPIEPGDHRPSTNKHTRHNLSPKRSRTSSGKTAAVSDDSGAASHSAVDERTSVPNPYKEEPTSSRGEAASSKLAEKGETPGDGDHTPGANVTASETGSRGSMDKEEAAVDRPAGQPLGKDKAWSLHGRRTVGGVKGTEAGSLKESYLDWKSRALGFMEGRSKVSERNPEPGSKPGADDAPLGKLVGASSHCLLAPISLQDAE